MIHRRPRNSELRALLAKLVAVTFLVTGAGASAEDQAERRRTDSTYRIFDSLIHAARLNDFEYPFTSVDAPAVALVVHGSPYWDSENWIQSALANSVSTLRHAGVPVLVLASQNERRSPPFADFLNTLGRATTLPFEGDSHRIMFTGRRVFVLGGNFTECACDAVRSLIAFSNVSLRIDFVTRAIYEIPDPSTLPAVRLDQISSSKIRSRRLHDVLNVMSDAEMLAYLEADYVAPDTLPCPGYERPFVTRAQTYHYAVYRGERLLGQIGTTGRLIELHFD